MKAVFNRIYSDFFLPSRLQEYRALLGLALSNGYTHLTLLEHFNHVKNNTLPNKVFVHRHDIDTDLRTTEKIFSIEKSLGVKSSYFFRLSTIDIRLMKQIHAAGFEVGYHYEEIAQFCKDHNIHDWILVEKQMPKIRAIFKQNFLHLEKQLGFKIKSIASHGDFVNRKIKHQNHELLTEELRKELGIELEGYDQQLVDSYDFIQSDKPYPKFYREQITPEQAIEKEFPVIYLLTHPRHWHRNIAVNLKDNLLRIKEGLRYKK